MAKCAVDGNVNETERNGDWLSLFVTTDYGLQTQAKETFRKIFGGPNQITELTGGVRCSYRIDCIDQRCVHTYDVLSSPPLSPKLWEFYIG